MVKNKLYVTMLCPDCVEALEYLKNINYEYELVDITADIMNLKEFLNLRDKREEFNLAKELGHIGVPAILTKNDNIIIEEDVFKLK